MPERAAGAQPDPTPPPFTCHRSDRGRTSVIAVAGELDIGTVWRFERELAAGQARADVVVLDLRALEFLDSVAAQVILHGDCRVRAAGGRMLVIRGPHDVQWTFELVDAQAQLEFVDEPPGANPMAIPLVPVPA